jgi:hypothetical protein
MNIMDNNNMQNSSGMMNGMPPAPKTEKKIGPIVGTLVIVLVLIIAALYFFGQKLNTEAPVQPAQQSMDTTPAATMTAAASSSDDVGSLQSDLNSQLKDVDYSF